MEKSVLIEKISELKKKKNAIILAHYYTDPDVQEVCDFLGDSLELSRKAATTQASMIVFCGVHFMAETAAILSPKKKVLIPALRAGCSLADGITGEDLRKWKVANPDGVIVAYVNTTADVKAETDICCTSANAVKIVESIPLDKKVYFVPDYNLGRYIEEVTGRQMDIWEGNCCVHQRITSKMVLEMMEKYPGVEVLIHPESKCSSDKEIINNPLCYFYSTSGMIRHARESSNKKILIATEIGTIHKLKKDNPEKDFIPVDPKAVCYSMKKTTLEAVYQSLLHEQYQVVVPEELRVKALLPVERMML